jgi:hypothetical protein
VLFRGGVLTYLGRTQYATGRLQEAERSLERALSIDKDDHMARLYLGLTQARSGEVGAGVRQIEGALKGLYAWIDYVASRRLTRAYWDPSRHIRTEIDNNLKSIGGKDFEIEMLLSNAEWIGREIEEEIERVRREEGRELFDRDRFFRRGVGVGVGIGF